MKPPRKWPPRVFAIYLVSTIAGGVILLLFLVLIGLLYWMNASVPLPDPLRLAPIDKAAAYLYLQTPDLVKLPPQLSQFLTTGAPSQVERLIQRGNSAAAGPVLLVAYLLPGLNGPSLTFSVSLHKFPGQFYLVRRDIERRAQKQSLPMSLRYHGGKAIFMDNDSANPLPALCLTRATMIRSTDSDAMSPLIDAIEIPIESGGSRWDPGGRAAFRCIGKAWPEALPNGILSAESEARWQKFSADLLAAFPALRQTGFESAGEFKTPQLAVASVAFMFDAPEEASALAARLGPWLTENGPRLGLVAPKTRAEKRVVNVDFTVEF